MRIDAGGLSSSWSQILDLLEELSDKPIAFHRYFATLTGDVESALFLSQATYWQRIKSKETGNHESFFYKTQDEWEQETALGRRAQENSRKILKRLGVISERLQGVPATLHYHVDFEKMYLLLSQQIARNAQSSLAETSKLDCANPPNKIAQTEQTRLRKTGKLYKEAEITPESTSENTNIAALPSWLPLESWKAFTDMRKEIKKPVTKDGQKKLIAKLDGLRKRGCDLVEVLDNSTINNWLGVFEPRNGNGHQNGSRQAQEAAWGTPARQAIKEMYGTD